MDTEDYKELRQESRQRKRNIQEDAFVTICQWCNKHEFAFYKLQPFQIRIDVPAGVIDIFPTGRKYHNITTQVRGSYKSLPDFLESTL